MIKINHVFQKRRFSIFTITFLVNLFAQTSVQARNFPGAISAGLGNAQVGALEVAEGVFANAGQLALFPTKNFGVSYFTDQLLIHFADNGEDALFPASLGYSRVNLSSSLEKSTYHINIAQALMEKNLGVGVDLQYRTWKDSAQNTTHRQTLLDFGAFARITDSFSAGLSIQGVALSDTPLANSIDRAAGTFLGVGLGSKSFAKFRFDIGTLTEQSSSGPILRAGLQTAINDWILTRIGYELNDIVDSKTLTLGVSFDGPQFGIHYAYQKESQDLFDERHVIDLNVPF